MRRVLLLLCIFPVLLMHFGCNKTTTKARLAIIVKLEEGFKRALIEKLRITLDYIGDSPREATTSERVSFRGVEFFVEKQDKDQDGQVEVTLTSVANPFLSADSF